MLENPVKAQEYSRQKWIDKSNFKDCSQYDAFRLIAERVLKLKNEGKTPLVIVDLDGTAYDVRHRTLAILKEWANANADNNSIQNFMRDYSISKCG